MRHRDAVLLNAETQADAAVRTLDLNIADPISALYIEVSCTNGATNNQGNFIADIITRLEVIDGSDTLVNLRGPQLFALYALRTGKLPAMNFTADAAGVQTGAFLLLFGRTLWDRYLALEPGKYRNPQVRVTFNKAAVAAAAATAFAAGNNINLSITAKVMEQGASPAGFLSAKEIVQWTSLAAGDQLVELPTDYPYRALYARVWEQGTAMSANITGLRASCDNDKFIVLNRDFAELMLEHQAEYGNWLWSQVVHQQNADAVRSIFAILNGVQISQTTAGGSNIATPTGIGSGQFTLVLQSDAGVDIAADETLITVQHGAAPFGVMPLKFGDYHDPDTWFDASQYRKFQAIATQGNAGAVCEVIAEQLRR